MLFCAFNEFVLELPGSSFEVKFGKKRTYCVEGRMFARAGLVGEDAPLYGFKAGPSYEVLIDLGVARQMPYLGRARWVELLKHDALSDEELLGYVRQSHELVAGFRRKRSACRA